MARSHSSASNRPARQPHTAQARALRDTLLRHWTMLRLVPRYPTKITSAALTAALIAEGFGISKRSVERDLDLLSAAFPLLCDNRAKPYGWSWQEDAKPLQIPGLQAHEALIFKLAEAHLASLLPAALRVSLVPYFKLADQRMKNADGRRGPTSWPGKVRVVPPTQPLLPPKVSESVFRAITQALLDGVQLAARYHARGASQPAPYRLSPLGLVQRGPISYLVATTQDHDDPHTFALHRFASAAPLDDTVRDAADFDLDAYIGKGAMGFRHSDASMELIVRFDAPAAEHLRDTPLSKDQKLLDDGDYVMLTATVPDTGQLRWWLLGFGSQIEVLAPDHLRKEMAACATAMAARYSAKS